MSSTDGEEDKVNPLGVYGRSKEAGERAVRAAAPHHVILRASWVYGAHGANFVKTILRLAAERPVLRVVADQHGCPTGAADIAAALIAIAQRIDQGATDWGTFHFTGAGSISWHEFAEAIVEIADGMGAWPCGARPRVQPITSDQYPASAPRPKKLGARLPQDRNPRDLTGTVATESHRGGSRVA